MAFESSRSVPRHPIFGKATIIMPDKKEILALIANISLGGLGLYSASKIKKLTQITVKITFTDTSSKEHEAYVEGIVNWVTKKSEIYELGISFTEELNSKKQPVLYKHITEIEKIYNSLR